MAVHRIQQGLRALLAFAYEVDYPLAEQYLNPTLMALFRKMSRSEQLHSLNVLRDVLAQSETTPHDLAVVALLHDVGKSRAKMAVWQKTLSVVIERYWHSLNMRLNAEDKLTFWNAPFVVRRWHPKWSAELLQQAGASECVVWLAEHHADSSNNWHDHPYYALLIRLKQADDEN